MKLIQTNGSCVRRGFRSRKSPMPLRGVFRDFPKKHPTETSTTTVTRKPAYRHAVWFPFVPFPNDDDHGHAVLEYKLWIFLVDCSPGGENNIFGKGLSLLPALVGTFNTRVIGRRQ